LHDTGLTSILKFICFLRYIDTGIEWYGHNRNAKVTCVHTVMSRSRHRVEAFTDQTFRDGSTSAIIRVDTSDTVENNVTLEWMYTLGAN